MSNQELLGTARYFKQYNDNKEGLLKPGNQVVLVDYQEATESQLESFVVVKANDEIVERITLDQINVEKEGKLKTETIEEAQTLWANIKEDFLENEQYGGNANREENEKLVNSFLSRTHENGEEESWNDIIVDGLNEEYEKLGSWTEVVRSNVSKEAISIYYQGGALLQAASSEEYLQEGYKAGKEGLHKWMTDKFGFKYSTFKARIQIYLALTNLGVSLEEIAKLNITKMRVLAQHADKNNIRELLEQAFSMTGDQFKENLSSQFSTDDSYEDEEIEFSNQSQTQRTTALKLRLFEDEIQAFESVKMLLAHHGVIDEEANDSSKQALLALMSNYQNNASDNILATGTKEEIQEYLNQQHPNLEWSFTEKEVNVIDELNQEVMQDVL